MNKPEQEQFDKILNEVRDRGESTIVIYKGMSFDEKIVIANLKQTGKYIVESGNHSYRVTKNYEYKPFWKIDWMTLGVTGVITLLAGIGIDRIVYPDMRNEIEQLQRRMNDLSDSLSRLDKHDSNFSAPPKKATNSSGVTK